MYLYEYIGDEKRDESEMRVCGVILYSITELESRSLALLPAQYRVDIEGLRVNRSDSTVVGSEPRKGKGELRT